MLIYRLKYYSVSTQVYIQVQKKKIYNTSRLQCNFTKADDKR